jgi:hypothetical protein
MINDGWDGNEQGVASAETVLRAFRDLADKLDESGDVQGAGDCIRDLADSIESAPMTGSVGAGTA